VEDQCQGWRLRHRDSDAPLGAPLTVSLRGERMPGARRTARSVLAVAVAVGALLRELPACGCGLADLVAAPSPEAPARQGSASRPPRSRRGACRPARLWHRFPRQFALPLGGLASSRRNSARAERPGAPKACP